MELLKVHHIDRQKGIVFFVSADQNVLSVNLQLVLHNHGKKSGLSNAQDVLGEAACPPMVFPTGLRRGQNVNFLNLQATQAAGVNINVSGRVPHAFEIFPTGFGTVLGLGAIRGLHVPGIAAYSAVCYDDSTIGGLTPPQIPSRSRR